MSGGSRFLTAIAASAIVFWPGLISNASIPAKQDELSQAERIDDQDNVRKLTAKDCLEIAWGERIANQSTFSSQSMQCMKALADSRDKAFRESDWSRITKTTSAIIQILETAIFGNHKSVSGIGILLERSENESFIVEAVSSGSPSYLAGIKAGDVIIRVNGIETKDLTFNEVIRIIRGPIGTDVAVQWVRDGHKHEKAIKRKAFSLDGQRKAKDFVADYVILFDSYFYQDLASELLELFPETLRLLKEEYGPYHQYIAEAHEKHALANMMKEKNDEALESINEAIAINSRIYGDRSLQVGRNLKFKSDILVNLEEDVAAIEALRVSLHIYMTTKERIKSTWTPYQAESIRRIGYRCNFGSTRRAECIEINRMGSRFAAKYLSPRDLLSIDIAMNHGYSELIAGNKQAALSIYSKNVDYLKTHHKDDLQRIVPAMGILAGLYGEASISKAENTYLEILRIIESALGKDSSDYISAQLLMAKWYAREGINDKAFSLLKQAESNVAIFPTGDAKSLNQALAFLGTLLSSYLQIGKFTELSPVITRLTALSGNHPNDLTAKTSLRIAQGYKSFVIDREYDEALRVWNEAKELIFENKSDVIARLSVDGQTAKYQYDSLMQALHKDISAIHALNGNYQSAVESIDDAIDIARSYNEIAWGSIIDLYMTRARYQIAAGDLRAANKSVDYAEKIEMQEQGEIKLPDLYLLRGGIAALSGDKSIAAVQFTKYTDTFLASLRQRLSDSSAGNKRQLVIRTSEQFSAIYQDYGLGRLLDTAAMHARLNLNGISVDVERALRVQEISPKSAKTSDDLDSSRYYPIGTSKIPEAHSSVTGAGSHFIHNRHAVKGKVSVHAARAALPVNGILVEFQKYQYHQRPGQLYRKDAPLMSMYMALVLTQDGGLHRLNLGPSEPIDEAISKAISATAANNSDSLNLWRQVSTLILPEIYQFLQPGVEIFLSPDSEISRVPFNALPDLNKEDSLLGDHYRLRVLSSGRDLLRLQAGLERENHGRSVVMANPDYGEVLARKRYGDSASQNQGEENWIWPPLPSTDKEGQSISALLGAILLEGKAASVGNLLSLQAPRVLHIATHGYFLESDDASEEGAGLDLPSRSLQSKLDGDEPTPLERSGLVLAGANSTLPWNNRNGYLTASDASSLNLDGTEIVVLSACSTGQGDLLTGEGVYGLQRSLLVAGARSALLSLWKVDDAATTELMSRFYSRLKSGESRSEALVNTQREFREGVAGNGQWKDPYYWATWQLVGDWRPIKGL